MKTCLRCGAEKPVSDYYERKPGVPHAACKACHRERKRRSLEANPVSPEKRREYVARYKERHPERVRRYHRIRGLQKFGLTQDDYGTMLDSQGGVCGICCRRETARNPRGEVKPLAVDHDHRTGRNRGLLCQACNTSAERIDSIPGWLGFASDYFARYSQ
jgi:hypothetical protein